jgi:hypothetical protein
VVALAWHVDYWNGLGWRDPYATRGATDRQRAYAARLGDEVYTPALVVDGAAMVVGSDRRAVAGAIARAPAPSVPVALRREAGGTMAEIGATPAAVSALLVAFDPMRVTAVGGGENGGRHLTEYHIVREATSLGTWQGAPRTVALPPTGAGRGIALLLQTADLRIVGAAQLAASSNAAGIQRA